MKLKSYKRKKNEGEQPKRCRLPRDPFLPSPHPVLGPCLCKLLPCLYLLGKIVFLHVAVGSFFFIFLFFLFGQVQGKDEHTETLRGRPQGNTEQALGPRQKMRMVLSGYHTIAAASPPVRFPWGGGYLGPSVKIMSSQTV